MRCNVMNTTFCHSGMPASAFREKLFRPMKKLACSANRAIRRPVDLTNRLGITPFGTLPYMRTAGEARRRTLIITFAMFVAIAGIPLVLLAINTFYMPLDLLIDRVVNQLGMRGLINQVRGALGI